jgi:hypothetical protein
LISEGAFFVFDHERAFNFLVSNPEDYPKELGFRNPDGSSIPHGHYFHQLLRGTDPGFDHFQERLAALNDEKIEAILGQIPYSLREDFEPQLEQVKQHLMNARENQQLFKLNLTGAVI